MLFNQVLVMSPNNPLYEEMQTVTLSGVILDLNMLLLHSFVNDPAAYASCRSSWIPERKGDVLLPAVNTLSIKSCASPVLLTFLSFCWRLSQTKDL